LQLCLALVCHDNSVKLVLMEPMDTVTHRRCHHRPSRAWDLWRPPLTPNIDEANPRRSMPPMGQSDGRPRPNTTLNPVEAHESAMAFGVMAMTEGAPRAG
jgi:hypothetical protein